VGLVRRVEAIIAWVMALKPVRVFIHYGEKKGGLLAGGLSYQAIFAVFAAIWVTFAIAGFVVKSNTGLQQALLDLLSATVPGLIDTGNGGAINPQDLFAAQILGWTGAIAAVGLVTTAIGWLASGRDAVRAIFGLPALAANFFILKLKDLGIALGFGAAMLLSAALSLFSTSALDALLGWVGLTHDSPLAIVLTRAVGLAIVLGLDIAILAVFYRVLSGIRIPFRLLAQGTLLAAIALAVIMSLGSLLLGGARSNPLLASFAVIIGLLIWFNLVSQVFLLGAAWIAVSANDAGVDLSNHPKRERSDPLPPGDREAAL
jgi:membrane protein